PAGEQHRKNVPHRQADLPRRTNSAHHRPHRGWRRKPVPRPDAIRNTAPGDPLPAHQRVDVLEDITMLTRRTFLQTTAAAAAAAQQGKPKRIAIVTTIYRYLSHAQHM